MTTNDSEFRAFLSEWSQPPANVTNGLPVSNAVLFRCTLMLCWTIYYATKMLVGRLP